MNSILPKNILTRGVKIYPEYNEEEYKKVRDIWEDVEAQIKANPVGLIVVMSEYEEKYAWVDERLEEMSSHVEEEDNGGKDYETFMMFDANYEWIDERLEELASHVEEEDDDKKNTETFDI